MAAKDTIISDGTLFLILKSELKEIYKPDIFGISPIWTDDQTFEYSSTFEIKDYQLYLKDLIITADRGYKVINGVEPEYLFSEEGIETVRYMNVSVPIKFTGAIIIANTVVKNYGTEEEIPCFSYKTVREFIFQDGRLVTTIDHSKAMLRIRKNLDMGLRNLDKTRDVDCIKHFIKTSFVGDYEHPDRMSKSTLKKNLQFTTYLQKIKGYYSKIKEI